MTPKKAIIIILVLFLIIITVFVFLYINKRSVLDSQSSEKADAAVQADRAAPANGINQPRDLETKKEIENIIEAGENEFGAAAVDAVKAAEDLANQRAREKLNSRTPEQIEADKVWEAEIQKMLEEVNNKVK
ncbi:hypothetical protein A3H66_02850 [Candidatus Falkowbacteria bacterium RIFCSPLOWO2_02_FULL_45_21]|uniref:Uncharacterized protein n=1 Tax=Candidatus Falkowbacteria bacterium RIFCSPLOWO2_02_FULL_45_21 TaxID=1797989 RepID=A0A1F5SCY8_9BACT|nr:MAG: hypothetical protein A3H66_02850 [Candidatus Falkowbacteria bacterium RIFCSPLOWO2_02_FULL_45_21]